MLELSDRFLWDFWTIEHAGLTWHKHPSPVLEADPSRYRVRDNKGETHWRDPWLAFDGRDTRWRAWLTAQHRDGDVATSETIALAESCDLTCWTQRGSVVSERLTDALEVPQVLARGRAMLVNVYPHHVPSGGVFDPACMSLLYRRDRTGSFRFDRVVERSPSDSRYVLKQVRPGIGLCWLGRTEAGEFRGQISDPFPFDPAAEDSNGAGGEP